MGNQLKAGAVLSYLALFLNSAISIIYTPTMLNLMGQSEYGLYSLANSAAGYIGVLNFGLGNAVIRYTAKYKALKDEESCSKIYGTFFIMYGILGSIALIAGIILTLNSHLLFSNSLNVEEVKKLKILMGIVTLNLSLGIGFGLFSVVVLAHERFIFQRIMVIISSIVSPLIMFPLLLMGYRSITMSVVSLCITFISILTNIYYCFKILKIKILFKKVEKNLFKEIIIFSSYVFLNLVISKLYDSTDQVILGIYSGTIAISIYTIGTTFTGYFSGFSSSISNVFLSKVTGMVAKEVPDYELSALFIRVGRIQYIIISFALSGFVVFGREFILLWVGKEFLDSFIVALIVLIPMIVSLIQSMGGIILQAKNIQKFKTIISALVAIVNVPLSIIFAQLWGAIGCALATAIAFAIGNIFIINVYYWKRIKINIPKFWMNILCMSFPFIISFIYGQTINKIIPANSWGLLIIKIIIFSAAFIFLMWFTAINKYEKSLFIIPFKKFTQRLKIRDYTA
ncbi:oligosaccharide flippase family protein [Neobacillus niacini]|uniref:oligosaccharide flippase family protein n=1 Tax=Neobacillus niacini TaxID=86668 RepID=UPI00285B0D6F|nr:oligosaccharide flippase family protein [Neobacillus niacini]MDR7000616.1 O-antigen/teichoic acid export membrane protein [Neobacillus niacini]